MDMRRVVVTGMGTVNPIGNCVEEFWENAKAGKIGIAPATQFNTDPLGQAQASSDSEVLRSQLRLPLSQQQRQLQRLQWNTA